MEGGMARRSARRRRASPSGAAAGPSRVCAARAWATWGIGAAAFLLDFVQRTALAVASVQAMVRFHVSASLLGLLPGAQFVLYLAMQVPAGVLADTWGPRRTLTAGATLIGAGALVFGTTRSFPVALLGRGALGLGDAMMFVNVLRLAQNWFPADRYALLSGLTGFAGAAGQMVATVPLAAALAAFGWTPTFVGGGLVELAAAAACALWVRDAPPQAAGPARAGRRSGASGRRPGLGMRLRSARADLSLVARNPVSLRAAATHLGTLGPYLAFTVLWGYPYLTQVHGLDRTAASGLLSLATAGFLAGSALVGWASDLLGSRRSPLAAAAALATAGWVPVVLWPGGRPPLPVLEAFLALLGLSGGASLLCFAVAKENNPPSCGGLATGFANLGGFSGAALSQPLVGLILDRLWTGATSAGLRVYPPRAYQVAFAPLLIMAAAGLWAATRLPAALPRAAAAGTPQRAPGGPLSGRDAGEPADAGQP
jgi:sugar phosphate permease